MVREGVIGGGRAVTGCEEYDIYRRRGWRQAAQLKRTSVKARSGFKAGECEGKQRSYSGRVWRQAAELQRASVKASSGVKAGERGGKQKSYSRRVWRQAAEL